VNCFKFFINLKIFIDCYNIILLYRLYNIVLLYCLHNIISLYCYNIISSYCYIIEKTRKKRIIILTPTNFSIHSIFIILSFNLFFSYKYKKLTFWMTKILPKVDCEVVHIVLKKHFWRKK